MISRRAIAELIGTAMLLAAIVGSGIMAERLADGNEALALLANSLATGGALIAILLTVGPISGAHLNPMVSFALAAQGAFSWRDVPAYWVAQLLGALLGVLAAHAMFGLPLIEISTKARAGLPLVWSEFVATLGLLSVVLLGLRQRTEAVPYAVAAYITAAYWFTASTSFANPAVTVARALTDTFTGIRPFDVPNFVLGQVGGTLAALLLLRSDYKIPE